MSRSLPISLNSRSSVRGPGGKRNDRASINAGTCGASTHRGVPWRVWIGGYGYDKTLSHVMKEGKLFCVFTLEGVNSAFPGFLARVPSSAWITEPHTWLRHAIKTIWESNMWTLGTIARGSSDKVRHELDEAVSRGKISSDSATQFQQWVESTAAEVKRLLPLQKSPHDR